MKSDSAFYIGTTHKVCEDYTVHGEDYIIVSDGCSGSPDTDIGARIVCKSAVKYKAYRVVKSVLAPLSSKMGELIGLPKQAIDVTFLSGHLEEEKFIIQMIGDGHIIIKSKDGIIYVISTEYKRSAPYYISYLRNEEDDKLWDSISNNDYEVEYTIINGEDIKTYKQDEKYSFDKDTFLPAIDFFFNPKGNRIVLNPELFEWVALSSDGLGSFYEIIETETSSYQKRIPYLDIVQELFKIKNTNGRFVQRRLNKFRKVCTKKGWYNGDDISLAVICMEKEDVYKNT